MLGLEEMARRCGEVFSAHPIVTAATLFGSYARGDADELSDADICYSYDGAGGTAAPTGLAFFGEHGAMRRELEAALGVPVDLVVAPAAGSCLPAERRLAGELAADGRGIYERQGI